MSELARKLGARAGGVVAVAWRGLWALVWATAETLRVDLGDAAPWVFGQMMGAYAHSGRRKRAEEEGGGK